MANQLDGKVAIVTGAAAPNGIGAAYAKALAKEGAAVVLADIDDKRAIENAANFEKEGFKAAGCHVDVTDLDSAKEMVKFATDTFGGVDILVNNAAIMAAIPHGGFYELDLEWYDRVMNINARSIVVCCKAAIPAMEAHGGGKIINQASSAAWLPGTVYRLSKLCVAAITGGLAVEIGREKNIQVNAIAPGMIHSEGGYGVSPAETREAKYKMFPHPRPDRDPEDLTGLLILLATEAGDYIHGQTINIDGGMVIRL